MRVRAGRRLDPSKVEADRNRRIFLYNKRPEIFREKTRQYRLKNPGKVAEAGRRWNEVNRDYVRQKRLEKIRANPEAERARKLKLRARRQNVEGEHTAQDIRDIFKSQRGKCAYCRVKLGTAYHVDHIVAISKGGTNFRSNLQLLCRPCNMKKHAKDPLDFARSLGKLL